MTNQRHRILKLWLWRFTPNEDIWQVYLISPQSHQPFHLYLCRCNSEMHVCPWNNSIFQHMAAMFVCIGKNKIAAIFLMPRWILKHFFTTGGSEWGNGCWEVLQYLGGPEVKPGSSNMSSLERGEDLAPTGVSCSITCISDITEWETALERTHTHKQFNKTKKYPR